MNDIDLLDKIIYSLTTLKSKNKLIKIKMSTRHYILLRSALPKQSKNKDIDLIICMFRGIPVEIDEDMLGSAIIREHGEPIIIGDGHEKGSVEISDA